MLIETSVTRADLCIVCGGQNADHLARHAAALYHRGLAPRFIVTGGIATDDGRLEAHQMRDVLLENGIPAEKILVEACSTNTGENMRYAMSLLEQDGSFQKIKSVIVIGQIHASRRFLMTLERHWPEVIKMFTTPNYYSVSRDKWFKDETFRADVLREYAKIAPYKAKDFIREINLDEIEWAIRRLQKTCKPKGHTP